MKDSTPCLKNDPLYNKSSKIIESTVLKSYKLYSDSLGYKMHE